MDETEELERLRLAITKLNRLRSNVVCTQNASWSNQMYPFVAILNEAGYEQEGATEAQMQEHLACYGGAGKTPQLLDHTPAPESMLEWLRDRGKDDDHPMSGSVQIHAERWRQQEEEHFTDEHDDEHDDFDLTAAGICYAMRATGTIFSSGGLGSEQPPPGPVKWPWAAQWWKPSEDPVRNLVKAGALIAAEIDRLQRVPGAANADS